MRVTGELGLPPFHMIANGGAVGLAPGGATVRYTRTMAPALWPRVVRGLEEAGLAPLVFSHRHPEPPLFHVSRMEGNPHHEAYLRRNALWCRLHADLAAAQVPAVVEVAALGRDDGFEAASARVLARLAGETRNHSMVLYLQGVCGKITEFFDRGTSKWRAFLGLFPEAAAHPEQVLAIGDEANDVEMVREAGLGIAMGNAIPALKAAADRVTADLDHEGVAEALETVLK
jgi:hypothetical protein